MPDVHKILKDLELRAVGLDPESNTMQEGYFTSFRTIGLPLHEDDYKNPWSPLGGNLKASAEATAAATAPAADPATAPKNASSTLTADQILAANIGRDQQAYLNGFMLTDDQLRMNASYAVMPGASKVSDAWFAVITGANGIPDDSTINDDLKAAYDAAKAVLTDADDNPTKHYESYLERQEEYEDALTEWRRAYSDALADPIKLQNWPREGRSYSTAADRALDKWTALGHKDEIDKALNTLAAQGIDPSIALIARAKKRYANSLVLFEGVGEVPYTMLSPESWFKSTGDGWTKYSKAEAHHEAHYSASQTSYGGSAGVNLGFWSVGGGFDHAENQSALNISGDDLSIEFEYCTVDVKRPWMDSTLLSLRNWFLMGDYKTGCISDGTMGQQRETVDPTFFPSVVTSLILVRNVHITWGSYASDQSTFDTVTSGGGSVGWGPFAVSGHYSHGEQKRDVKAEHKREGLHIEGMQLLGYVSMINPLSPAVDSADYLKN